MISASGLGSGLDIDSIVSQLMVLERRPLDVLESRQANLRVKISAHGQLKSAVSQLQKAAQTLGGDQTLANFSARSTDEAVFTATAGASASAEAHTIEVLGLAQSHRLASSPFADPDTVVGTGTLTLSAGAESFGVTIDGTNNTLAGIRDAINASPDNTGVSASILNVDGGSRLILTADETGTANALTVSPDAGLSALAFTEVDAAVDAELDVDGFRVTSASNKVSDVITGVTLDLQGIGQADLSMQRSTDDVTTAISGLVDAYNTLRGSLQTFRSGALEGDSLLVSMESRIREVFSTGVTNGAGETSYAFEVGLSFDKFGALNVDDTKLSSALAADIDNVVQLFSIEDTGLATQLDTLLEDYVRSGGTIDSRTDSLDSQNRTLDRRMESVEFRLSRTEERIRHQFTTLDGLISQLQGTSSYLTQQLGNLPFSNLNGG